MHAILAGTDVPALAGMRPAPFVFLKDFLPRPFHEALAVTRGGNVFTTHTAVEAGFDRFSPELIRQYLSWYAQDVLRISVHDLLALLREAAAG